MSNESKDKIILEFGTWVEFRWNLNEAMFLQGYV